MNQQILGSPIILLILFVWSMVAKGVALWRAANSKQRNWFVAILVLNTIGIVELLYLFKYAKKTLTFDEIRSWMPKR
jgi:hypothetical protein